MRFVVFLCAIGLGIATGNEFADQNWGDFWAYFGFWVMCIVILLATRDKVR